MSLLVFCPPWRWRRNWLLTYPAPRNANNVKQAITRQGPDLLDTRVWWDKK